MSGMPSTAIRILAIRSRLITLLKDFTSVPYSNANSSGNRSIL